MRPLQMLTMFEANMYNVAIDGHRDCVNGSKLEATPTMARMATKDSTTVVSDAVTIDRQPNTLLAASTGVQPFPCVYHSITST